MSDVDSAVDAYAQKQANAFVTHLDALLDSITEYPHEPEDELAEGYTEGFDRAIDEARVNLHYFIDGRLPRDENGDMRANLVVLREGIAAEMLAILVKGENRVYTADETYRMIRAALGEAAK